MATPPKIGVDPRLHPIPGRRKTSLISARAWRSSFYAYRWYPFSGLTLFLVFASSGLFAGIPLSERDNATGSFLLSNPNITVRFSNPSFDCVTSDYCLDVQFQSDQENQRLFGMNVRFFYEELGLEFLHFTNFANGYGAVAPDPPQILTSPPAFGYNFFGFGIPGNGPAEWVNGAIQLVDFGQDPIYISTTDWTTIFQICFSIDETNPDSTGFCPPIVWDLEEDPANGGYLLGDDGVVITIFDEQTGLSEPAQEFVEQFNWAYSGGGAAPPFGAPVELVCIPIACGLDIVCPANITISCSQSTLPDVTGNATSNDLCPGVPVISYVDSTAVNGCGYLQTIYRKWTVTDSCSNLSTCIQVIEIQIDGSVCGVVMNDLDEPIPGVSIQLLIDLNGNGSVDTGDTIVAETLSDILTGTYCFYQVEPCDYILTQTMPPGHLMYEDFDISPDPDGDDSGDGADSQIPVTLTPCETDSGNIFVDFYCPAIFPNVPADTICEGDFISFSIPDPNNGLCVYTWSFGSGSSPTGGIGLGPHEVGYASTPENQLNGAEVTLTLSRPGCPDTTEWVSTIAINEYPDATIDGSSTSGCYYTNRIFKPVAVEIPGASYQWNFGIGAVPPTAIGYGPHTVYYDTIGSKEVKLVIHPNASGADCSDSSMINFAITSCPGSIGGTVKAVDGSAISGVNLKLYTDADTNGVADNAVVVRNVFTNSSGTYAMASLEPGHYVVQQVQPVGWMSLDDGDLTDDGDMVDNLDSLDNIIPLSLSPMEIDVINYFTEIGTPGTISGSVFNDIDDDMFPDTNEVISGVSICLYPDINMDGVADSYVPSAVQVTDTSGAFMFNNVAVGHYVICEIQPSGYFSLMDKDVSNDNDVVINIDYLNDTIPVTITNGESDAHNYFMETDSCNLTVMNTLDNGKGSLRLAVTCATSGDTILFDPSLSGNSILLNTGELAIDKSLVIYSALEPRVTITSSVPGLISIAENKDVEFHSIEITSGLACGTGAAFSLDGIARLFDVIIHRNPSLSLTECLIKVNSTGQLIIHGNCMMYNQ